MLVSAYSQVRSWCLGAHLPVGCGKTIQALHGRRHRAFNRQCRRRDHRGAACVARVPRSVLSFQPLRLNQREETPMLKSPKMADKGSCIWPRRVVLRERSSKRWLTKSIYPCSPCFSNAFVGVLVKQNQIKWENIKNKRKERRKAICRLYAALHSEAGLAPLRGQQRGTRLAPLIYFLYECDRVRPASLITNAADGTRQTNLFF